MAIARRIWGRHQWRRLGERVPTLADIRDATACLWSTGLGSRLDLMLRATVDPADEVGPREVAPRAPGEEYAGFPQHRRAGITWCKACGARTKPDPIEAAAFCDRCLDAAHARVFRSKEG